MKNRKTYSGQARHDGTVLLPGPLLLSGSSSAPLASASFATKTLWTAPSCFRGRVFGHSARFAAATTLSAYSACSRGKTRQRRNCASDAVFPQSAAWPIRVRLSCVRAFLNRYMSLLIASSNIPSSRMEQA